jgi:hypothetical protein
MNTQFFRFDDLHLPGDSAMHPIAPRPTRPAALFRLAGSSPRRSKCHDGLAGRAGRSALKRIQLLFLG